MRAVKAAGSQARVVTLDTNKQLIPEIENGSVRWAIDQQPYLQGHEAIDTLCLMIRDGDILGGGKPVLTGPTFIDARNVKSIAAFAEKGTR